MKYLGSIVLLFLLIAILLVAGCTTTNGGGSSGQTATTTATSSEVQCSRSAVSGESFQGSFAVIPDGWSLLDGPEWGTAPIGMDSCDQTGYYVSYINTDGWIFEFYAHDYVEWTGFDWYTAFVNEYNGKATPILVGGFPALERSSPGEDTVFIEVSFGNGLYARGLLNRNINDTIHLWMDDIDDGGSLDSGLFQSIKLQF